MIFGFTSIISTMKLDKSDEIAFETNDFFVYGFIKDIFKGSVHINFHIIFNIF